FSPYPGSKSYEDLKSKLADQQVFDMFHYDIPRSSVSLLNSEKLGQIRSEFYKKVFLNPSFFLNHMRKYFKFYIKNMDVFYRLSKGLLYIR
ncbi:MAG: hypothetical protein K8I00_00520, partial [Candidatus Omnitrophica bacterium]|nr:hypothetical protein [Candidatus Omnitrophota bacterium]